MQAKNESIKLKKLREGQEREVWKIVPGLTRLSIEEGLEDANDAETYVCKNFEELAMKLRSGVLCGNNIRVELLFGGEEENSKGEIKKIKSNDS